MTNENTAFYAEILKGTGFSVPEDIVLPKYDDFSVLGAPKSVKGKTAPNRICYQPMEGQDADENGCPTEKTFERYRALAEGGAGIIWIEAVSVLPEARSNPHQLMITENTLPAFEKLVSGIKNTCREVNGYTPLVIIQLNHSGRHSKPNGVPAPLIGMRNKYFDKPSLTYTLLDDAYLASLPEVFAHCAALCEKAGADGVDIKCCHGYLFSELLSAYDREGAYGGKALESRAKLLTDSFAACDAVLSSPILRACRLNIYDGYQNEYSFGEDAADREHYDLTEPKVLIGTLVKSGLDLLNVTMGSPYVNPDVSRPYRPGIDKPKTNALASLARLFGGAAEIHRAFPTLPVVNTGVSGLCGKSPYAASGMIKDDMTDFVGFGRMSFAYPSLAKDILNGTFSEKHACVGCSGCSTLKKNGLRSGCIVRDPYYTTIYKEFLNK